MNKDNIKHILKQAKDLKTYQEKLDFLHNKFEGEQCYILGCGPSMLEVDINKLRQELSNSVCLSIKIAFFSFTDLVDFQFFNCKFIMQEI